jgi:uncharacterized SAM-binding protein YcdF (DUF218 family)
VGPLRRHPVLLTLAATASIAVVAVSATGLAVWRAAHTDDASRVDRADAIVVLGAAQYDGRPSPVFRGRLEHAALLYRERRAEIVLVLGGSRPGDRSSEAEAGRGWLIAQGLPPDAVAASPVGSTTLESLRAAAGWMRERGLRTAFLVSDPWHNLRVKRMASDLGIVAYASATWRSAARTEGTRFGGYLRETFAYLYYRLLGR